LVEYIPADIWARNLFNDEVKVKNITNNLAKSFNNSVKKYRSMTIAILPKKIRLKLMSSFHDTFALIAIWKTHTTPYVRKLLDKSIGNSRHMGMILASFNEYQVFEGHTRIFIDLEKKIILMQ